MSSRPLGPSMTSPDPSTPYIYISYLLCYIYIYMLGYLLDCRYLGSNKTFTSSVSLYPVAILVAPFLDSRLLSHGPRIPRFYSSSQAGWRPEATRLHFYMSFLLNSTSFSDYALLQNYLDLQGGGEAGGHAHCTCPCGWPLRERNQKHYP